MNIRLLFFGATADIVGMRNLETSLDGRESPADVVEHLAADHPDLKKHRLLFAINESYADAHAHLADGDQLAIFTAVSGG